MGKEENAKKGRIGEKLAAKALLKKGYVLLDQNFRCKMGEVDLICRDQDTIVFIEVKFRKGTLYGRPSEAVNMAKQKHIAKTALWYLNVHGMDGVNVRFDVVEILEMDGAKYMNHIVNAFGMPR